MNIASRYSPRGREGGWHPHVRNIGGRLAVKVTVFKQSSKIREKTRKLFPPVIGRRPFKSGHKEMVMSLIKCIHALKLSHLFCAY